MMVCPTINVSEVSLVRTACYNRRFSYAENSEQNFFEFEGELNWLLDPSNAATVSAMGQNGIKYVDENYSWKEIVRGYTELCQKVIDRSSVR